MKKNLLISIWSVVILTLVILISLPLYLRILSHSLKFYYIPSYQFSDSNSGNFEDNERDGYIKRQFLVCLFPKWCSYNDIYKGYLVVYRDNNKFKDKKFGSVKEIKEKTYILEVINENKEKNLIEIPKKWVFGKD